MPKRKLDSRTKPKPKRSRISDEKWEFPLPLDMTQTILMGYLGVQDQGRLSSLFPELRKTAAEVWENQPVIEHPEYITHLTFRSPESEFHQDSKWMLPVIRSCPNLVSANFNSQAIEGRVFAALPRTLTHLYLRSTNTDDRRLQHHLKKFRSLVHLDLSHNTHINKGLKYLAKMKSLRYLNLKWTNISDPYVDDLKVLCNLDVLNVSYTVVTPCGMRHVTANKIITKNMNFQDLWDKVKNTL